MEGRTPMINVVVLSNNKVAIHSKHHILHHQDITTDLLEVEMNMVSRMWSSRRACLLMY